MPPIGRNFVTISEFKKLDKRVLNIEKNLAITPPDMEQIAVNEVREKERKLLYFYIDPDLYTDFVTKFNKDWVSKIHDFNYADHKTHIYLRMYFHGRTDVEPKKNILHSITNFGEYYLIFEYVLPKFSFFMYILGEKHFVVKNANEQYTFQNFKYGEENFAFNYSPTIVDEDSTTLNLNLDFTANLNFVLNPGSFGINTDTTKVKRIIYLANGYLGIYAKKLYTDFNLEILPSKTLNSPLNDLKNLEFKPKLNILLEDKIFTSTTDPLPLDLDKRLDYESMFVRFYSNFDEKDRNKLILPPKTKIFTFKQTLSGVDQTVLILSKLDIKQMPISNLGFIMDISYYSVYSGMRLYFVGNSQDSDKIDKKYVKLFFFFCNQKDVREKMVELYKDTFNLITKKDFYIFVNKNYEKIINISFL